MKNPKVKSIRSYKSPLFLLCFCFLMGLVCMLVIDSDNYDPSDKITTPATTHKKCIGNYSDTTALGQIPHPFELVTQELIPAWKTRMKDVFRQKFKLATKHFLKSPLQYQRMDLVASTRIQEP